MSGTSVLVVSGRASQSSLVKALRQDFTVHASTTGDAAEATLLRHRRIGLAVIDGGGDLGVARGLATRLAAVRPGLRYVLVADGDLREALEMTGNARIVPAPWREEVLVDAVRAGVADADAHREARLACALASRRGARLRELASAMSGLSGSNTRKLAEANVRLRQSALGLARLVSVMAEGCDPDLASRRERVARTAVALARRMEWPGHEVDDARMAALLADVGRAWSSAESCGFDLDGSQAERSAQVLAPLPFSRSVIAAVRHQHERWNGLGAPEGLRGGEIPRLARLLALAEAYVTLAESGEACEGMAELDAAEELRHEAGRAHDPEMVEALVAMVTECDAAKALPELELVGGRR